MTHTEKIAPSSSFSFAQEDCLKSLLLGCSPDTCQPIYPRVGRFLVLRSLVGCHTWVIGDHESLEFAIEIARSNTHCIQANRSYLFREYIANIYDHQGRMLLQHEEYLRVFNGENLFVGTVPNNEQGRLRAQNLLP